MFENFCVVFAVLFLVKVFFNISCKAGLMLNSLSFCWGKYFFFLLCLSDKLAGYSIVGGQFLSFSILRMSSHSLMVFAEKSADFSY